MCKVDHQMIYYVRGYVIHMTDPKPTPLNTWSSLLGQPPSASLWDTTLGCLPYWSRAHQMIPLALHDSSGFGALPTKG